VASAVIAGLAVVSAGYLPIRAEATAAVGDCAPGADWGSLRAALAAQTVDLVNAHRAGLGLGPLSTSPALEASAVWKARHMARYSYMAHNDPAPPVARSAGERMQACGYGASWGENIAYGYGTAQAVVSGWLASPGHRANIENASWVAIGSGAAAGASGTVYWAQSFGSEVGEPPPPPTTTGTTTTTTTTATTTTTTTTTPTPAAPRPPRAVSANGAVMLRGLRVRPSRPLAGQTVTSTVRVFRNGRRTTLGRVGCYARVQGRPLEIVVHGFRGGLATCSWHIPATSRGKLASGVVVVGRGAQRVRASFRSWIA
jgi:uncharacterized protein YkwD